MGERGKTRMRRRDSEIGGQKGRREALEWYDGDSRFYHLSFLYTITCYYMLLYLLYPLYLLYFIR